MRILFVNGHLKVGGGEKSLLDTLKAIDYTKHQVDLLLFEGYGEYYEQLPPQVNVILCDLNPTFGSFKSVVINALKKKDFRSAYSKFVLTLCNEISPTFMSWFKVLKVTDKKYDCAIAYRVGICAEYVAYCVKASKKYVWWHNGEFNYSDATVTRWNKTLTKLDEIVCVSDSSKKLVTPHFKEKADAMCVIPNMVRADDIVNKSKEKHPYADDGYKIVSLGRMSPEKRMINCVYAMDKLVKLGYDNLKWYLIGDGSEFEEIQNTIKKLKLTEKVICLGRQGNPYPYIADADLFVHPSYVESQGLAVLEAMALLKPCVITRSLGVEEFVVDGENAVMAEQSVDSLVEKIVYMIETGIDKKLMIESQKKTLERFSPEHISKQLEELINRG